jgi:N-acetylglucosamine kinase-like BadF-type ATPase
MNDGNVALYSATKGVGIQAISGTGSIVVGRNAKGDITRSGGYPAIIFGNEGSSQWIAHYALNYASKYLDGSVGNSPLIEKIDSYFNGLSINKLIDCAIALRRRPVDSKLAVLVYEAAKESDSAAINIQQKGVRELIDVAGTCVRKLGFAQDEAFISGVWGSVFEKNELFYDYYREEFTRRYPNSKVVFPAGDAADGATQLAFDYLDGKVDFIANLI